MKVTENLSRRWQLEQKLCGLIADKTTSRSRLVFRRWGDAPRLPRLVHPHLLLLRLPPTSHKSNPTSVSLPPDTSLFSPCQAPSPSKTSRGSWTSLDIPFFTPSPPPPTPHPPCTDCHPNMPHLRFRPLLLNTHLLCLPNLFRSEASLVAGSPRAGNFPPWSFNRLPISSFWTPPIVYSGPFVFTFSISFDSFGNWEELRRRRGWEFRAAVVQLLLLLLSLHLLLLLLHRGHKSVSDFFRIFLPI